MFAYQLPLNCEKDGREGGNEIIPFLESIRNHHIVSWMKAIASSTVAHDLLEGKNASDISEFGIITFPLQSIPCMVLEHMVWHLSRTLNSVLM